MSLRFRGGSRRVCEWTTSLPSVSRAKDGAVAHGDDQETAVREPSARRGRLRGHQCSIRRSAPDGKIDAIGR